MSETKTAVGTLDGIMEKSGDWHELHIARDGMQYPLKLSTKKQELVELARAAGSNVMEWTYTEQDSGNANPHQPGKNYINRYFEGVAPVTSENAPNATAAGAAPQDGMSKQEWAAKDRAADKRALIATSVSALSHTMPSDPSTEDLNKFIERVSHLSTAWHKQVIAEREGDETPF